jgi:hypothetical protein
MLVGCSYYAKQYTRNVIALFYRRSNPNLTEWMERMGIPDTTGLHAYYANRILNITSNINVESIVWQDVRDENVSVGFLVGKL